MGKALGEIGLGRAARYGFGQLQSALIRSWWVPPQLRVGLLRLFGAVIGAESIVHPVSLINLYRGGFGGLRIGRECFIGEECMLDLAAGIRFGDQVTLSARVTVLTHMNVGFRDHPLQARHPAMTGAVEVGAGSFIGAGALVLAGVRIGPRAVVGAGALVHRDVPEDGCVAGVPARALQRAPAGP